nr:recombinase family protein [uncultured Flavobacterium sp.]
MERVCIYARVSSNQSENQDYQSQITELTKIIKQHGYDEDNIDTYAEKISGYKETNDRPELDRLLKQLEKDPTYYRCCYISEISRLSRKPAIAKELLLKFSRIKLNLYINSQQMFTFHPDGTENNLVSIMLSIAIEFADIEAKQMKLRMTRGKMQKVTQEGKVSGNNQAYGYTSDINKKFVIDSTESIIVKQIFELYKNNQGTQVIAKMLNQQGTPTRSNTAELNNLIKKAKKEHSKLNDNTLFDEVNASEQIIQRGYKNQNTQWDEQVVRQILMNETYKGKRTFKGITFTCPAIIDEDLFDECTAIRLNKNTKNIITIYEFLLKDLMYCGCCGRKYVATYGTKIKDMKAYKCYSTKANLTSCGNKSLNISLVESIIYNQLINSTEMLKYLDSPNNILKQANQDLELLEQQLILENASLSNNENEIKNLINITTASTNNFILQQFQIKEQTLSSARELIEARIETLKKNILDKKKLINNFNVVEFSSNMIEQAKTNRHELTAIFKQYIDKIIVNTINKKQTLITIYYRLNGSILIRTIKTIINVSAYRDPKILSNRKMEYGLIVNMSNDPVYKDNILLIPTEDILNEYNSIVEKYDEQIKMYHGTLENGISMFDKPKQIIHQVPTKNQVLIEDTYPVTDK